MAWYTRTSFDRSSGASRFVIEDPGTAPDWREQVRSATKVDPLPEGLVATRVEEEDSPPGLSDFLTISSKYAASNRFREIVEALEPNKHQFIPVNVRGESTVAMEESRYWIVNVLESINAALSEATIARLRGIGKIPTAEECLKEFGYRHVFIDQAAVAGRHLWRTDEALKTDLYFSEELMRRIQDDGLHELTIYRAIEVEPA